MPRRPLILCPLLLTLAVTCGCSVNIGTKPAASTPPAQAVPAARTERVTIQGLNLRQGPSVKTAVLDGLNKDEVVTVLDRQGNWIRVRTAAGREGFVYGAYLTGFDIRPGRPKSDASATRTAPEDVQSPSGLSDEEERDLWN